jgi:2-oxoglutarate ferredoxin oxidoreductase subunit alpha
MNVISNDFVIEIATVNGSGSQSANNIILRSLFRMGIPVGGKNLFPSNIAGLPTWFTIRANENGYTARRDDVDIFIALNPQTLTEDLAKIRPKGWLFYPEETNLATTCNRDDIQKIGIPFKRLVDQASDSIKLKKLLVNMVYVGVLGELLEIPQNVLETTITDQFNGKATAIASNLKALNLGREFARENIASKGFPFRAQILDKNVGKILIDGNTSSALGLLFGGCSFVSWYPITPSTSVIESFSSYAETFRKNQDGTNNVAIIQAEDELAAISMVAGASWAGARAMTATSGPGLSLMSEAAGLFYYGELPGVLWDVQRVGPSTGMPTRTAQGDILSAYSLSHGDTKQIVLIPGSVEECFEFGQTSLDLAETLQSLVIVLSDLDLGMNFWMADEFKYPTKPFQRGKILNAESLNKIQDYHRYKDVDDDGIPYRTIPDTPHPKASYFLRGSGHNEKGQYTEDPKAYRAVVDRLNKKYETAKTLVPSPEIIENPKANMGIIAFGSTALPMKEALDVMSSKGLQLNYLRLKALPFNNEVEDFVNSQASIFVVEQNRDGQMASLLKIHFPHAAGKFKSVLHYDGLPLTAKNIYLPLLSEKGLSL